MPSTCSSSSARRLRSSASRAGRAGDDRAWRAASRTRRRRPSRPRRRESRRTPGPLGATNVVTVPGAGRKPRPGSSPLMRNSKACPRGSGSSKRQRLALGDAELLAHQVDAGDLLGDRVLDLQAGVDLEEADRARPCRRGTRRCRRRRTPPRGRCPCDAAYSCAVCSVGEERRGRLLDDLLVAPLQRAVAGRDDDDVAVGVGEHLRLDVARLVEVALDEALAAAEGGDGLADGRVVQLGDLGLGAGDLQPAAAAAERRLDGHRQAVLGDEREHLVDARHRVGGAGHERRADLQRDVPGGRLVAERGDGGRRRADPGRAGVDARPGRTRRSPTGSRSRGAPRRRRSRRAPAAPCRCAGTSRPASSRRARTPRRRPGRAARRGRARRRPRPSARPASRQARATRTAISPRLAIRTLRTGRLLGRATGGRLSAADRRRATRPVRGAGAAQDRPAPQRRTGGRGRARTPARRRRRRGRPAPRRSGRRARPAAAARDVLRATATARAADAPDAPARTSCAAATPRGAARTQRVRRSQGDVPVLLGRQRLRAWSAQQPQRLGDLAAGLRRLDDRVDEAALGGDVRRREGVLVLLDELRAGRLRVVGGGDLACAG